MRALHSYRIKIIAAISAFVFFQFPVQAQVQILAGLGFTNYNGDLGGSFGKGATEFRELNMRSTRMAAQLGFRGFLTSGIALRGNVFYGKVSGDDANTADFKRNNRNLNFFSPVMGMNVGVEWHFKIGLNAHKRFFIYSGIEYFAFNPKTKYKGETVELQPLGTEGQFYRTDKLPYQLYAPAALFSVGYRVMVKPKASLSIEFQSKFTGTDYLDDVSTQYADKTELQRSGGQMAVDLSDRSLGLINGFSDPGAVRGNPAHKDNYYFLMVTWEYWLDKTQNFKTASAGKGNSGGKNKSRCFSF